MTQVWWGYLVWIGAAALIGWTITKVFSDWLKLSRQIIILPYLLITSILSYGFILWSNLTPGELIQRNWRWGVLMGILVGAMVIKNVRSQPASQRTSGWILTIDLLWSGIVYGLLDALLLNVLPVIAVWQAMAGFSWAETLLGRVAVGGAALVASLLVTTAYHWGYAEFRNETMKFPLIGNGMVSLASILSLNPLGSLISHISMHLAAVLQGPATTLQLPPHYSR